MRGLLSTLIIVAAAASAGAQSVRFTLTPTSSVRVEGTSNVHAWHAASTELATTIQVASPISAASKVESVSLSLPVTSLKSGKGGLDKNLYKALKADQNPTITFVMKSYASAPEGDASKATITGLLTVNGVEKEITALATMTSEAGTGLRAVGSATFRMTEFGIKPVTALLGTIRTGDQVTVKFELTGTPAQAVAALPPQ
jgi:polyisoprenoid-binding protein YceI